MKNQFLKTNWKVRLAGTIALLLLAASALMPAAPAVKYDHLWLVVTPDAPQRAALERDKRFIRFASKADGLDDLPNGSKAGIESNRCTFQATPLLR